MRLVGSARAAWQRAPIGETGRVDADESLAGGLDNEGRVVRRGETVRRPVGPWTPSVHRLLAHLTRVGYCGVPEVLGVDSDVEVLSFIEGVVAVPPYPGWSGDDELLVSVADLQRRYHEAVATFSAPVDAAWRRGPTPNGFSGVLVCHNDICLENVVIRDGRSQAFIDWDLAGPVDPLWDIAIAMRHWVPMRHPDDLDEHRTGVDLFHRFRLFAETHRLDGFERSRVLDALVAYLDSALVFVREQAESRHTGHLATWNSGYEVTNRRARQWVDEQRGKLLAR